MWGECAGCCRLPWFWNHFTAQKETFRHTDKHEGRSLGGGLRVAVAVAVPVALAVADGWVVPVGVGEEVAVAVAVGVIVLARPPRPRHTRTQGHQWGHATPSWAIRSLVAFRQPQQDSGGVGPGKSERGKKWGAIFSC